MKKGIDFIRILTKAQKYLSDGILIFDAKQKGIPLVYINKSVKKITGYSSGELIGKSYEFLENKESSKENLEKLRKCFGNRHNTTVDLIIKRKDGLNYYCRITITPIHDSKNNAEYFVCILRDITEARKKLKNDIELTVMKSTLRTTNDIINNYMNSLYLFRLSCESHCDVNEVNLEEFDKQFHHTLNKLKKINELKEYKERALGEKFSILTYA